jgi:hypothetical protein
MGCSEDEASHVTETLVSVPIGISHELQADVRHKSNDARYSSIDVGIFLVLHTTHATGFVVVTYRQK